MKKDIHPEYNQNVKVVCSCGNTFVTGSTVDEIVTELCSECHPFYTGEQKIVDTDNLVKKFEQKREKASDSFRSKRQKMEQRKKKLSQMKDKQSTTNELTLKDMLDSIGK